MSDGMKSWFAAVFGVCFLLATISYFANQARALDRQQCSRCNLKNTYDFIQEASYDYQNDRYIRHIDKIWIIDRGEFPR